MAEFETAKARAEELRNTLNYHSHKYYELPEVVTEYLKSKPEFQEDKMQRNFWNKFGMYILILIIVGYFFTRFRKSSSSE